MLGTSSGIHAWHSKYYIRNIQCRVGDHIYKYFTSNYPDLIKIMDWDSSSAVIGIPQKAPESAILRESENALEMLSRVKRFNEYWVRKGHRKGANTNNVSATVYIQSENQYSEDNKGDLLQVPKGIPGSKGEWEAVGQWMWDNHYNFNGLSVLPYDGGVYPDTPFQEITEEEYYNKLKFIPNGIDFTQITEEEDQTDLSAEAACAGGQCELTF